MDLKQKEFFQKALEYATVKNGKCLSTEYVNAKTKMRWKYENPAHKEWASDYEHVVSRNRWCIHCGYSKETHTNNLYYAKEYAKSKQGICLSDDEFVKTSTFLKWKCNNPKHPEWIGTYHNVVDLKTWCRCCAGKFTADEYLVMAKEYAHEKEGQCLSTEYKSQRELLKWKCKNSQHNSWLSSYQDVVKKHKWCKECK